MDLNVQGGSTVQVPDDVFGAAFKPSLIHQVVVSYMNGARSGTKAQKNRAAVAGGGAKPWRQKGTGRARAGTVSSPLFRSGGATFAAKPRNHEQKVNRKMYRGALRSILSELVRQDRLVVVEEFALDSPRTKGLVAKLGDLLSNDVLIVVEDLDENLQLASRNLYHVGITDLDELDPVSLIGFHKVVVTTGALKRIGELFS